MSNVSAQISMYPLKQLDIATSIDSVIEIFHEYGLEVHPGSMSTIILGSEDAIFSALQRSFSQCAKEGEVVMVATISNACPTPDILS